MSKAVYVMGERERKKKGRKGKDTEGEGKRLREGQEN